VFDAPLRGNPSEFLDYAYITNTRGIGLLPWWKLHDPDFNRCWLIHPCDERTDG